MLALVLGAQTPAVDKGVAMLKSFYTAYILLSSGEITDLEASEAKLVALRRKYCTPACLKQFQKLVEDTIGDPIIQAQDSYKAHTKTLVIKKIQRSPTVMQCLILILKAHIKRPPFT
ncbi:hypothetical protein HH214_16290 [Mucilaginibacter robiniae]|uniref:Uncharacterized protein n=1 Tax=Mucilaginibacter robiniae TaxID=2728022 RepID=A0A7L5EAA9_9SPHI|nr:hypothetical protein [Mucilaginibacter robiniae]QJD97316.1 hypothetical protein HH214_16290 [Mucilaginibacter robiniae]